MLYLDYTLGLCYVEISEEIDFRKRRRLNIQISDMVVLFVNLLLKTGNRMDELHAKEDHMVHQDQRERDPNSHNLLRGRELKISHQSQPPKLLSLIPTLTFLTNSTILGTKYMCRAFS